ncbi:unnamed protein product [Hanseniaspora opuntiae]
MEFLTDYVKKAISKTNEKKRKRQIIIACIAGVLLVGLISINLFNPKDKFPDYTSDCSSYGKMPLLFNKSYDKILHDIDYKLEVVNKLSGAVRVPTVVYDSYGQPDLNTSLAEDKEYSEFQKFHDYLEKEFPLVHKHLKKEIVNKVGLVYTWTPDVETDEKPLLLMAHQDVVPVEPSTLDKWSYPPFEGHYDDLTGKIYGRGALDTKLFLIAQFATVELLLKEKYELKKPLIMAYGFDEEKGGDFGAKFIADFLLERYGKDGIEALFDEGEGVVQLDESTFIASPGVAEMGYCDVYIELDTPGGHSSAPNHWDIETTGIGIISEINHYITLDQFQTSVSTNNPVLSFLQCNAKFNPESLDPAVLKATTQSMDVIKGGIKSNAMPENVVDVINHRIDIQSSVNETVWHDLKHVMDAAEKYDLGVTVDWRNTGKEPVSTIPYDDFYDMVASTVVSVYNDPLFAGDSGKDVEVLFEGTMSPGNTDSVYYALNNLVNGRVYRFSGNLVEAANAHTVDEWCTDKSLLTSHAFIYSLIVNFNEAY